jgi:hypothetical protein
MPHDRRYEGFPDTAPIDQLAYEQEYKRLYSACVNCSSWENGVNCAMCEGLHFRAMDHTSCLYCGSDFHNSTICPDRR